MRENETPLSKVYGKLPEAQELIDFENKSKAKPCEGDIKEKIGDILDFETDLCLDPTAVGKDDCGYETDSPACRNCQLDQIMPLINAQVEERDTYWREKTQRQDFIWQKQVGEAKKQAHQGIIDAMVDYTEGKISFERCAEIMNMNYYELAEFCYVKGHTLEHGEAPQDKGGGEG